MGISLNISSNDETYVFSLVRWGFIRKLLSRIFKVSPFQFTPSYELAIYKKNEGKILLSHSYFAFHFLDTEISISRMNWMKTLFEEGRSGVEKLIEEIPNFDPKREALYLGPSDYFDWEISRYKKNTLNSSKEKFHKRLLQLIDFGMFGIFEALSKEIEPRFPSLSQEDIDVMVAALTNELVMANQKDPVLSFRQANMELLSREVSIALENKEIAESVALILRIKGVMLPPEKCLKFLERAKEIDPHGHVPNGKEIARMLRELGI